MDLPPNGCFTGTVCNRAQNLQHRVQIRQKANENIPCSIADDALSWPKRASQGADQEPGPGRFKSAPRGLMFAALVGAALNARRMGTLVPAGRVSLSSVAGPARP